MSRIPYPRRACARAATNRGPGRVRRSHPRRDLSRRAGCRRQVPGTGTIVIVKDAVPDGPHELVFAGGGGLNGGVGWILDDYTDPTHPNQITFADIAAG